MISKLVLLFIILFQTSTWTFSEDPQERILRGTLAKVGQFPYVVHVNVTRRDELPIQHRCSGAILTEVWVVTAAHCYNYYVKNHMPLSDAVSNVTAGTVDLERYTTSTQSRTSSLHVMLDKNPNKKTLTSKNNDLLIIKVNEPFQFNGNVGAISIAKHPLPAGKELNCLVMGYGFIEDPEDETKFKENFKLYYTSATLDGDKFSCRKRAEIMNEPSAHEYGEEHVCVDPVDYRSTPCMGDSGGPLVCYGLTVATATGRINIHHKSVRCGAKGNFHIYASLGYHEAWLRKHVTDLPAFKLMEAPNIKADTSRGDVTRFHMAEIGLGLITECIVYCLSSNIY